MLKNLMKILALLLVLSLFGCGEEDTTEPPLDDAGAAFGFGKADGPAGGFSACELREVLKLVNESTTTVELLEKNIGVHTKAALRLFAHRVGADGVGGTGDDDLFDDLAELDGVEWVGPKALEAFANYARPRCLVDLATRPFIHRGTFASTTGGGWGRNAPEFEATLTVGGVKPRLLYETLKKKDEKGRTVFSRLSKSDIMTAFTYGFAIDEMPWSSDATKAREALPYVVLSIESDRYKPDAEGQQRELSLGTDNFDDIYYDTKDYELFLNGMALRGRSRWDSDTVVRRLLIQAKSASIVDENGIKQAAKIDVRTDSGDRYLATLNDDVRSGTVEWSGSRVPVEAIKSLYDVLDGLSLLKDMQGYFGVLILDPKVYLRSDRRRFHFNFTDTNTIVNFYKNGLERVASSAAIAQAALDSGLVADADRADVEALIAMATGIADGTLLRDRAAARLGALNPPVTEVAVFPQDFGSLKPTSKHELDVHQIVAEEADKLLNDYASALDGVDREITGTSGLKFSETVELYRQFSVSLDKSLGIKTTIKPFRDRYLQFVSQGDTAIQTQIDTFNTFAAEQVTAANKAFVGVAPMTRESWDALGKHLTFEMLKISQRMITNGGTVGQALWFDAARLYYIPRAPKSSWSNFLIDTFDVSYFLTPEEWERIPADQRTPVTELPADAIFHTKVVNEVQIELTEVEAYIARIEELKTQIAAGSTPKLEEYLAGAQFALTESIRTLQVMGELKGPDIISRLKKEGLNVTWGPAAYSKGDTGLRILTDTDSEIQ